MDYNWLPPELDPTAFPEYLLQAHSPIAQFEHQVRFEACHFSRGTYVVNSREVGGRCEGPGSHFSPFFQ